MDFSGKVAIVTGGAQGIGKAISMALLKSGMKVIIFLIVSERTSYIKTTKALYQSSFLPHLKCKLKVHTMQVNI